MWTLAVRERVQVVASLQARTAPIPWQGFKPMLAIGKSASQRTAGCLHRTMFVQNIDLFIDFDAEPPAVTGEGTCNFTLWVLSHLIAFGLASPGQYAECDGDDDFRRMLRYDAD